MQKKLPTYSLEKIQNAFDCEDKLRMTLSARRTVNDLNLSDADVVKVIQEMKLSDFHKSMPPIHENYTAWQDVYRPHYNGIQLYVKFQINASGELIVSFKEK